MWFPELIEERDKQLEHRGVFGTVNIFYLAF
jgi:hypothetical protein